MSQADETGQAPGWLSPKESWRGNESIRDELPIRKTGRELTPGGRLSTGYEYEDVGRSDLSPDVVNLWVAELRGPINGRIQTLRGMCTDELPHVQIDAMLAELSGLVYSLRCAIEFPPGKPTETDLERGRQLAREHGWNA